MFTELQKSIDNQENNSIITNKYQYVLKRAISYYLRPQRGHISLEIL